MEFECFVCLERFADKNTAITHLKTDHKIKEKQTNLKCLVNYASCQKHFLTFSGLRKHLLTCKRNITCGVAESAEVTMNARL